MTTIFAVCRTAEVPAEVIDNILTASYEYSEHLSAGIGPLLAVLPGPGDGNDGSNMDTVEANVTMAGTAASLPPSPFIGMSAEQVAERLGEPKNRFFAVLDARTAEDSTVLLAAMETDDDGEVTGRLQTVRAAPKWVQATLVALDIATMGFEEVIDMAEDEPGGVYGASGHPGRGEVESTNDEEDVLPSDTPVPPLVFGEVAEEDS
ncbi:1921b0f6-033d-43f3-863f-5f657a69f55f [Thermothielavioides terrestris]|uniref:1921b0f6-033d-43f3-863f-5f657a69f55f n=1 Tax=Thermothielavioides terrestris TaxID=2587410 RepID=A0A446BD28_9PEZI|nr:1921b0f6-033d-43f3-863f-5f657a69f55f [Thermothielavioides terrestris]